MKFDNRCSAALSKKRILLRVNTTALIASITAAFVIGFTITSLLVTVTASLCL